MRHEGSRHPDGLRGERSRRPRRRAAKERLSPADRAAINATLDVFVNHAVKRKDVAKSYDVVTPELRGGMTRAQWSRGEIPVYPYPAAGRRFHEWTIQYRTPRRGRDRADPRAEGAQQEEARAVPVPSCTCSRGTAAGSSTRSCPVRRSRPRARRRSSQAAGDFGATPGGTTYNRPSAERKSRPPLGQLQLHLRPVRGPRAPAARGRRLGRRRAGSATRELVGAERQDLPPLRVALASPS